MQAISSQDYEVKPAQSLADLQSGERQQEGELRNYAKGPVKNSFQQMLAESEMKGVAKKAPKKGMQLGKPKVKTNALLKELEK